MSLPRSSRRRVVLVSSDAETDTPSKVDLLRQSDGGDNSKLEQTGVSGKLKRINRSSTTQKTSTKGPQRSKLQTLPKASRPVKGKIETSQTTSLSPSAKPIYSFFNVASQRPGLRASSASPTSRIVDHDESENIQDNSDDEQVTTQQISTQGSSIANAAKKRRLQLEDDKSNVYSLVSRGTHKFTKVNNGGRVASPRIEPRDQRPWTERFAPQDLSELAVHPKKVKDVRQWLEHAVHGRRSKVLVLKGPAGTGKTSTLQLLARTLGMSVLEWKNPTTSDWTQETSNSASAQFVDFVGRAGRSAMLDFDNGMTGNSAENMLSQPKDNGNQLLLVEEFPNTFSRSTNTLQSFRSSIAQYLASPLPTATKPTPLVMVISETISSTNTASSDSFTAHRLLGPELINHPYLDIIEFNPVAPTILTKALQNIVVKEARASGRRKAPGPYVLKYLASAGDIRSAISSLEFLCLRGDEGDIWSSKVLFTKPKTSKVEKPLTQAEEDALKLVGHRGNTLDIFHSVGKVIYNKRIDPESPHEIVHPPPWLSDHRREKIPENNTDRLFDEIGTDSMTYLAALHENYVLSCSGKGAEATLDCVVECANSISDADLLSIDRFAGGPRAFSNSASDNFRQEEISFQVAVRGLWFYLPSPVHRAMPPDGRKGDAHRIFYPSSLRLWKKAEEVQSNADLLAVEMNSDSTSMDLLRSRSGGIGGQTLKRCSNMDTGTDYQTPIATEPGSRTMSSARKEMLTERLPYLASIVASRDGPRDLLERIYTVTRITSSQSVETPDLDLEEDTDFDHQSQAIRTEALRAYPSSTNGQKAELAARHNTGTLVENVVQALVLEDDDIVDD